MEPSSLQTERILLLTEPVPLRDEPVTLINEPIKLQAELVCVSAERVQLKIEPDWVFVGRVLFRNKLVLLSYNHFYPRIYPEQKYCELL